MEAKEPTVRQLFDPTRIVYIIPTFQRRYVWNEEDHWKPLWQDITELTAIVFEARRAAGSNKSDADIASHFMGALVTHGHRASANEAQQFDVIDGQQRLTTVQILLRRAFHRVG